MVGALYALPWAPGQPMGVGALVAVSDFWVSIAAFAVGFAVLGFG